MTGRKKPWFRTKAGWKAAGITAGVITAFILVPLFGGVFIIGSVAGLTSNSYALHKDTELRQVARTAPGVVTDIRVVHHSGYRGAGHTDCTPTVVGTVDGEKHTWTLTNFEACDGYYHVGQRLQVMYDENDIDRAGVYADDIPATYRHNLGVAVQVGVLGLVMAAAGVGCWVYFIRSDRRKKRAQHQSRA